jgi:hypothetical protein
MSRIKAGTGTCGWGATSPSTHRRSIIIHLLANWAGSEVTSLKVSARWWGSTVSRCLPRKRAPTLPHRAARRACCWRMVSLTKNTVYLLGFGRKLNRGGGGRWFWSCNAIKAAEGRIKFGACSGRMVSLTKNTVYLLGFGRKLNRGGGGRWF